MQDFAKASQLGLWSGNSQLWSGLRPYSVFNNESCESLNSSTARLAIVIIILVIVIIILAVVIIILDNDNDLQPCKHPTGGVPEHPPTCQLSKQVRSKNAI